MAPLMEDTQNIIKEQNRVVEPPRADWLALVQEAAIEPDLPICDAHHHLFDLPGFAYMLPQFLDDGVHFLFGATGPGRRP